MLNTFDTHIFYFNVYNRLRYLSVSLSISCAVGLFECPVYTDGLDPECKIMTCFLFQKDELNFGDSILRREERSKGLIFACLKKSNMSMESH